MGAIFAQIGENNCKSTVLDGIDKLKKRGCELSAVSIKTESGFSYMQYENGIDILKKNALKAEGDGNTVMAVCKNKARINDCALSANKNYCAAVVDCIPDYDEIYQRCSLKNSINCESDLLLYLLSVINYDDKSDMIKRLTEILSNSVTYAFISFDENAVYCKAGESPLFIGIGKDAVFLSSEAAALSGIALKCMYLKQGESAKITSEKVSVYDSKMKKIKKGVLPLPEINEELLSDEVHDTRIYCPLAVKETVKCFTKDDKLNFGFFTLSKRSIEKINKIIITGESINFCIAKLAAYNFQTLCDISSVAVSSAELKYSGEVTDKNTLLIVISPRGEDINAVSCVKRAKIYGAKTLGICCNKQSHLALECDSIINPRSDSAAFNDDILPFITMHLTMCFLALYTGYKNEIVSNLYLGVTVKLAQMLSGKVAGALKYSGDVYVICEKIVRSKNIFITGLYGDGALAQSGAYMIRKSAKINAYYSPLDELSEYESDLSSSFTVAVVTNKEQSKQAKTYLKRLELTGTEIAVIADSNTAELFYDFENVITFPDSVALFNSLPAVCKLYQIAKTVSEITQSNNEKKAI